MTISDLKKGEQAVIKNLGTKDSSLHLRLLGLGLLPGDTIQILNKIPFKGPIGLKQGPFLRFALRHREASKVQVEVIHEVNK